MDATGRPLWVSGEDLEDQVARDEQEAGEVDAILEDLAEFVPDEDTDLPYTVPAAEEAAVHVYRESLAEPGPDERMEDAELQARAQIARAAGTPARPEHEPDVDEWVAVHEDFAPEG